MKKFINIAAFVVLLVMIFGGMVLYNNTISGQAIDNNNFSENNSVTLVMFYGKGCPHCSQLHSFLEDLEQEIDYLDVKEYEIYFSEDNRELFENLAEIYDIEIQGVPTVFVGDNVLVGFSNSIGEQLKEEIEKCYEGEGCKNPLDKLEKNGLGMNVTEIIGESSPTEDPEKTELKKKITIPAVLSAAAVDAINPCAFAVLIILLSTILATNKKKRALFAGLAFTLSIYISYFLMGLGLYSAISAAGLTHSFYAVVAVLAIFIGIFNLKDYLWYGKWFVMEVPPKWRPRMKCILKGVTSVPGAFLIGFVISLFLLPCTSGPYIVILGLLSKMTTRNYAIFLLLIYNLVFILPMILITFGISFGITTTEKAESWRQKKLKILHLIAGIIILLLGIGMLISLWLGFV